MDQLKATDKHIHTDTMDHPILEVHRVTLYLTPDQWRQMSAWSAPAAAAGGDRAPWLHMFHESGMADEYRAMLAEIARNFAPYNITVCDACAERVSPQVSVGGM
jgi:hypothetical protein